jgi:GDSL-like lipase/acylhydrolase family protein
MMSHIVLLGDSIFDNAAYVAGGPAVIGQLQKGLPAGWKATLLARDGSITADVIRQLDSLPADTTHIVVSTGGNDALIQSGFLQEPAQSVADVLYRMAEISARFEQGYLETLRAVLARNLATTLCAIYYPRLPDPLMQQITVAGLTAFNDCILRAAFAAGLPVLDLRLICASAEDYANEIEPSSAGGAKIADAIVRVVTQHDFATRRAAIFI